MSIRDQLTADLKTAMKERDTVKRTVIRSVMTAIKESEQKKREDLVKKALKKHGVTRPSSTNEDAVTTYDAAVDEAVAAEKVEQNAALDESEIMSVIQKMVKQRQDSIQEAQKGGREDIVATEQVELDILSAYLPRQMTREEILSEAKAMIADTGAESPRDMGKVMGPLTAKLKGRADGRMISEVVRELLSE